MSWPLTIFSEVIAPEKGSIVSGPFGSNIGSRFFVDSGVPVIRGNNLTKGQGRFRDEGFVFLTEQKASEFPNCVAVEDDLIFTAAGSIGQVGIIPKDHKYSYYIISNKQIRARIDRSKADPLFVYHWFSSNKMTEYIISQNNGGAVPLLNLGIVKKLPIPMPELGVQKRIAHVLSSYDELIENNRRRIELLEETARLLYREWFVRLRFPGHEGVAIVDGVPEGWQRRALEDLLVLQRGFDLPTADREDGEVPVYGSTGVVGYHDTARVGAPMLVTGRSGSLGQVNFVMTPCWPLNTSLWVKEFRKVSPWYGYFLLKELELSKYNGGASVPTLDRKVVHRLNVLLPPSQLRAVFDDQIRSYFDLIENLKAQIAQLTKARDLLLPRLMDGRLEV